MIKKIFILFITILLVTTPYCYAATTQDIYDSNEDTWGFQWTITDLNLAIGDYFNKFITKTVGQKITIQSLIFNEVRSLDANFFKKNSSTTSSMHKVIKEKINEWYGIFRRIALVFYLGALLVMGVRAVLSGTAVSRADLKDMAMSWITGILILFLFNYVMRYAFEINETFVERIKDEFTTHGGPMGTYVGGTDDFELENYEFRSPSYRSKYSSVVEYGGENVNAAYFNRMNDYRNTADMMRIMRAYAGISHRIIFCVLWMILLFQLVILLVKYYKRYFMIALLIIAFPFVTISFLIDKLKGGRGEVFRVWCVEFFVNVFTQSIHAIIYAIIAATCINRVQQDLGDRKAMNWIIIIVAINFLSKGEKLTRKLLGADGSKSMAAIGDSAQVGKKGINQGRKSARSIGRIFRHDK